MSLFNLIWVALFFYYGYLLLFPGIAGVDFGIWDEIIGILLLLTAIAGLYFIIKTAMKKMSDVSGRLKETAEKKSALDKDGRKRTTTKAVPAPEGFYDDFRSEMVRPESETAVSPVGAVKIVDEREEPGSAASVGAEDPFANESLDESLRRLREEYNLDSL